LEKTGARSGLHVSGTFATVGLCLRRAFVLLRLDVASRARVSWVVWLGLGRWSGAGGRLGAWASSSRAMSNVDVGGGGGGGRAGNRRGGGGVLFGGTGGWGVFGWGGGRGGGGGEDWGGGEGGGGVSERGCGGGGGSGRARRTDGGRAAFVLADRRVAH